MQEQLNELLKYVEPSKLIEWAMLGFKFILVICVAFIVLRIVKTSINRIGESFKKRSHDIGGQKRIETLIRVFEYAANIIILMLGILIALDTIGFAIGPILAAAGVVGLAVGFGAQSLVKDYFTGIVMLLENQIRADDVITIDEKTGKVEKVTLRYVRIRDLEGNVHFIPNGQITSVCNRSLDFSYALLDIGIAYKEDVEQAWKVMQEVGDKLEHDDEYRVFILEPLTIMGVNELGDSAVVLRARYKTVAGEQWSVKREYQRRIKAAFDSVNIEIPFPHVTVYRGDLISKTDT